MSQNSMLSGELYPHPFSKAYWKQAASEFKKTKVLIFAALMIALRVVLKTLAIPIAADLKINIAFFINAYGAMVFGPVVAIVAAAISDTLGCIVYPSGAYFFPFIFVEIAGSLTFALCFYRARVSTKRVMLSRFIIDFGVNIVLNTPIMMWYYQIFLGKYYAWFDLIRIVKNLAMFPFESILLTLFLRLVIPPTRRLGYIYTDTEKLKFTKKNVITLIVLFVIGVGAVSGYAVYNYNTTSVSKSFSNQERLEKNTSMEQFVRDEHPELADETIVTIIESGYRKVGKPELTYSVAVYRLNEETFQENVAAAQAEDPESTYSLETLQGYSKSKAKQDTSLESLGMATIVVDKKTGELISYSDDLA